MDYREICISRDNGSAEGYAVGVGSVNLQNYLTGETELAETILTAIREQVETISVFKSLRVDEDSRGNGIGSDLVSAFLAEPALRPSSLWQTPTNRKARALHLSAFTRASSSSGSRTRVPAR